MGRKRKNNHPTERAIRWAEKLSYSDRLKIQELLFRLYSISEDLRIERSRGKK